MTFIETLELVTLVALVLVLTVVMVLVIKLILNTKTTDISSLEGQRYINAANKSLNIDKLALVATVLFAGLCLVQEEVGLYNIFCAYLFTMGAVIDCYLYSNYTKSKDAGVARIGINKRLYRVAQSRTVVGIIALAIAVIRINY